MPNQAALQHQPEPLYSMADNAVKHNPSASMVATLTAQGVTAAPVAAGTKRRRGAPAQAPLDARDDFLHHRLRYTKRARSSSGDVDNSSGHVLDYLTTACHAAPAIKLEYEQYQQEKESLPAWSAPHTAARVPPPLPPQATPHGYQAHWLPVLLPGMPQIKQEQEEEEQQQWPLTVNGLRLAEGASPLLPLLPLQPTESNDSATYNAAMFAGMTLVKEEPREDQRPLGFGPYAWGLGGGAQQPLLPPLHHATPHHTLPAWTHQAVEEAGLWRTGCACCYGGIAEGASPPPLPPQPMPLGLRCRDMPAAFPGLAPALQAGLEEQREGHQHLLTLMGLGALIPPSDFMIMEFGAPAGSPSGLSHAGAAGAGPWLPRWYGAGVEVGVEGEQRWEWNAGRLPAAGTGAEASAWRFAGLWGGAGADSIDAGFGRSGSECERQQERSGVEESCASSGPCGSEDELELAESGSDSEARSYGSAEDGSDGDCKGGDVPGSCRWRRPPTCQ